MATFILFSKMLQIYINQLADLGGWLGELPPACWSDLMLGVLAPAIANTQ